MSWIDLVQVALTVLCISQFAAWTIWKLRYVHWAMGRGQSYAEAVDAPLPEDNELILIVGGSFFCCLLLRAVP